MSEASWRIGHLEHLESPWGNAGGVVKTVEEVERMAQTGVGWIEAGSYTLDKRYGNDKDSRTGEYIIDPDTGLPVKVYHHDSQTGETYNSLGMPNKGLDAVEKEIPQMAELAHKSKIPKKLIVNVAPVTDEPVAESIELVSRAYEAGADGVILNGGCPNVITEEGGRHEILSTNPRAFMAVLNGLRPVTRKFKPVFVRTSPQRSYDNTKTILRIAEGSKAVSAVFKPNSFNSPIPLQDGKKVLGVKGDTAGKTGPATAEDSFRQARWAKEILNGSGVSLIRSGGIANFEKGGISAAAELRRTLALGALGAGTTFYYEAGEAWEEATDRLLRGLAA
jgi:dihydroorotate dehydrogenase